MQYYKYIGIGFRPRQPQIDSGWFDENIAPICEYIGLWNDTDNVKTPFKILYQSFYGEEDDVVDLGEMLEEQIIAKIREFYDSLEFSIQVVDLIEGYVYSVRILNTGDREVINYRPEIQFPPFEGYSNLLECLFVGHEPLFFGER